MSQEGIETLLSEFRRADADWSNARTWSLVYSANDEHDEVLKAAYSTFFHENGLSGSAFPSLARMERDVVHDLLDHVGADPERSGGTMASGGTESIILAIKAYRDRSPSTSPNLVVPRTAHPAFIKAGALLGVEVRIVPVDSSFTADVDAIATRLDHDTIAIAASAPAYPFGLVDPIREIADLASEHGVGVHVDACLGGIALPFLRQLGHKVPEFDFSIPGVTSMSVDLHKYGFAAKGASAVLYRDRDLRRYQFTVVTEWPGGALTSPTLLGTRPGGAIASAWVALNRLGSDGYKQLFAQTMDSVNALLTGFHEIGDLEVIGKPPMSVFAITSRSRDVFGIADYLEEKGWRIDRQMSPDSIHHIVTPRHTNVVREYLQNLADAYRNAPPAPTDGSGRSAFYGVTSRIEASDDLEQSLIDDMSGRYDTRDDARDAQRPD